jgi:hypothetical protein
MKKVTLLLTFLTFLSFVILSNVSATVLTFEDLSSVEIRYQIPTGYGGFTWAPNTYVRTKTSLPSNLLGSGYDYGTQGNVSIYTAGGNSISMASIAGGIFDFNGAYITSAYQDREGVTIEGWKDGLQEHSTTIETDNNTAHWFNFNFDDVDTVRFIPGTIYTLDPLWDPQGKQPHFVIDNITYNESSPIPEPGTLLLLGSGLVGIVGYAKFRIIRKKK